MAPRLRQHALARIDQHDGEVGGRGAGRHVARVLLMAGRVGDDELALRRREEAIGDIDGDALLALGLQPVDQQREIDVVAGRAVLLANRAPAPPAGPRRSAWCRRAAGRSASTCRHRRSRRSGSAAATCAPARPDSRGRCRPPRWLRHGVAHHQKYPSRFFFSIEPASSWSMRRPWRSEVRAVSISPTILERVGVGSMAPVSG